MWGRPGAASRVGAHERLHHAHLHPAGQELRSGVGGEAADVVRNVGRSREAPAQHDARLVAEVAPRRPDVASPGSRAQARHARGPGAVQRKVALREVLGPQRVDLGDAPPVVGEEAGLPLVVPPELHALVEVVAHVPAVPLPHALQREVQAPPLGVGLLDVRRPRAPRLAGRQEVALGLQHAQQAAVAHARLPDHPHADAEVPAVPRQLVLR
mmetsp:Transcript_25575/g.79783  ORF Transcript_25575/g.79783 Transcript_25575/m.79783 type:complete len:212 (-) Transcript_25575:238-873(-)